MDCGRGCLRICTAESCSSGSELLVRNCPVATNAADLPGDLLVVSRATDQSSEWFLDRFRYAIYSVIFSTIFRHFEANTCRNFELEEDFC